MVAAVPFNLNGLNGKYRREKRGQRKLHCERGSKTINVTWNQIRASKALSFIAKNRVLGKSTLDLYEILPIVVYERQQRLIKLELLLWNVKQIGKIEHL